MKKIKITRETIALMLITVLSAILNFGNLSIEGTGNLYYAAAVRSMTMNLKNFFFVSFDPAGFVSVDKPPLGFWLQAISAKIFGFSGWSIILPQALAGVISVVIIYKLVKRAFGSVAGLISAACLAVTPVFVAASRNNTIDNVLVLFLLLACAAFLGAVEKGNIKYLIVSMVLVGLGFNIKMLQAYMILPALYITYLFTTTTPMKKKIINLSISTIVLIAVSLSWATVVDAVPSKYRPYVDSSTNNTVMQLIFGHNGMKRLGLDFNNSKHEEVELAVSKHILPSGRNMNNPHKNLNQWISSSGNTKKISRSFSIRKYHMNNAGDRLKGFFSGHLPAGITRLFSKNVLSDQIVWFIPLAILGFIVAAIKEHFNFCLDNKAKQSLSLWFMWFFPEFIYFSYSTGNFHPYYLTMLAPPIAALTGIGIICMWEFYKEGSWKSWFLPIALTINGMIQLLMASYLIDLSVIIKLLMILIIALCFGSSAVLCAFNVIRKKDSDYKNLNKEINTKLISNLVIVALIGLLITPFAGSSAAIFCKLNRAIPTAGLELLKSSNIQRPKAYGQIQVPINSSSTLIKFLEKNKTRNQKYLLVVSTANQGSGIIIKTGEAVMAVGGFLGKNNSLTLDKFKSLAQNKKIRYVMVNDENIEKGSNCQIMNWVKGNGKIVPSSEYSNKVSDEYSTSIGRLYDLKGYVDNSSALATTTRKRKNKWR